MTGSLSKLVVLASNIGPLQFELDEHTGTHFDAPAHFIAPPDSGLANAGEAGDLTAEKIAFEQFIGPAAVIDVSSLLGSCMTTLRSLQNPYYARLIDSRS